MKFIHTSDWHLGQNLLSRSRIKEHEEFLNWLLAEIDSRDIDTLIVSGDIFDCGTPPGYAQKMYYDFLCRLAVSNCKRAFIMGGNHDSPAFLEASQRILGHLQIHVIAKATENFAEMVYEIKNPQGEPEAIVCAVPFLRDRDVRKSRAGESYDDKSLAMNLGISHFYREVVAIAHELQKKSKVKLPVIGTGHLFVSGCSLSESVREFSVGNLGGIHSSELAEFFDYLALGHLHICQQVGKNSRIRYCGSPIPMSFDECSQPKYILTGDTEGDLKIDEIEIPVFQKMRLIKGDLNSISQQLEDLREDKGSSFWVEIQCVEEKEIPQLSQTMNDMVEGTNIEILAVRHLRKLSANLNYGDFNQKNLNELNPLEVFDKRLEVEQDCSEEEIVELKLAFREILQNLYDGDLL